MKKQCDQCGEHATHHLVEIVKGEKIEKHFCDFHAEQEGMAVESANTSIDELLVHFVKYYNQQKKSTADKKADNGLTCSGCGKSLNDLRQRSLLGCPKCYDTFGPKLNMILQRSHENGSHHIGKVPKHASENEQTQVKIVRMKKQLDQAVEQENYELAAQLRDTIKDLEPST